MPLLHYIILLCLLAPACQSVAQAVKVSMVPELSFKDLNVYYPEEKHPEFGGFSGMEFDPSDKKWYLVTDGRPPLRTSYLYRFNSSASGFPDWTQPDSIFTFADLEGAESIRITADRRKWIIASEGDDDEKFATGDIHTADFTTRKLLSSHEIITRYPPNRGLEAIAIDGQNTIWTMSEWPSYADKDFIRIRGVKMGADTVIRSYSYPINVASCLHTDKEPGVSLGNGVSEMVMENDRVFWAVERCFDGNITRIKLKRMRFPITNTTVIQQVELLDEFDLNTIIEDIPDNIEGAVFGPILPDGNPSLCLIADDNFSRFKNGKQKSVFIVLRIEFNN